MVERTRLDRKGGQAVPVTHACPLSDRKGDSNEIGSIEGDRSQITHVETLEMFVGLNC